ncbi:uncharacterized protein IL334_003342 [Kwoniella shivajii]|uniref:Rab-GAP TBC domain-containing protein n=1 Tax=Kwoniella shivajii TaxID=564305 RepID=A0ABZ1D1E5_9TREE|nr:hypothetical protein IL334_003342 [Kwoniella shivajii]
MSTNLQDWVELLNAEQHVQVDKLREHARHGVASRVRGEVWLYLLEVLSENKTAEISSLVSLNTTYQALPSELPTELTATLLRTALGHHTKRFRNETYAGLITSLTSEQSTFTAKGKERASNNNNNNNNRQGSNVYSTMGGEIKSSTSPMIKSTDKHAPPPISLTSSLQASDSNISELNDLNTIRSQLSRILPPPPSTPPSRHTYLTILEEVLGKFHNAENMAGRDEEYRRNLNGGLQGSENDWIYLATPFVCVLSRPVGIFLGFQKLMEKLRLFPSIPSRLASFLTLFRLALPELHSYCEDEQVPYVQVAMSWMTTLLAKEMWLGDVLRLWDAYLASDDMFALHCYVCVGILSTCKETLEELDGSEAKLMLLDLPPLDVDRLLQDAANLRVSFPLPRPVENEP